MRSYTDNQGRTWKIDITVATIRRIRAVVPDFDAADAVTGLLAKRMAEQPEALADVLAAILEPQMAAEGVSVDMLCEGLGGDAMGAAQDAVMQGMIDFFPSPAMRDAMRNQIAIVSPLIQKRLNEHIESLNGPERKKALETVLDRLFGNGFMNSPESPE